LDSLKLFLIEKKKKGLSYLIGQPQRLD